MVGSSKNIKLHFTKNNLFHKHFSGIIPQTPRRLLFQNGSRWPLTNSKIQEKIDLRDYFNKTSLFVGNFKINHQKIINKSKDSQKLKRVPYVLKNHNIYSVFSSTIKFFKSEILSKKLLRPFLKNTFNRQLISTITQSTFLYAFTKSMASVNILYRFFVRSSRTFACFSLFMFR